MKEPSKLELAFLLACRAKGLPEPVREYAFCPTRRWRADFAWPMSKVMVEVQGGEWVNGRHNRALAGDAEKFNTAQSLGWRVLLFTGSMLRADIWSCVDQVKTMLEVERENW